MKKIKKLFLAALAMTMFSGCDGCRKKEPVVETDPTVVVVEPSEPEIIEPEVAIDEDGIYDTKDEVALYIYTYHHLPSNYMTKKEARQLGWSSGALNRVVEGKCIGGDVFGNYEEVLPIINGTYYECDIDTIDRKSRGSKRIVYSDEWDIYYTEDHYETFEQIYGD